MTEIKTAK